MTEAPKSPESGGGRSHAGPKRSWTERWPIPRSWTIVFATVIVLIAGALAATLSAAGGSKQGTGRSTTTTSSQTVPTTKGGSPIVKGAPAVPRCPLSGQPAPGGRIPHRSAIAVKVDNYPAARPWSGINRADVVFEEPVEGFITRLVAVFQCDSASLVGPVRSARAIDLGIVDQLSHPVLVHVGGINPVISLLDSGALTNMDLGYYASLDIFPPGRYAPYDTYTNTDSVWRLAPDDTHAPAPIFTYSAKPLPGGIASSTIHIDFSQTSDETWTYNARLHAYNLSYSGVPATISGAGQVAAANVVVETVHVTFGPWVENELGALEVQANLVGEGGLRVFRDGREFGGRWERSSLLDPTRLLDGGGHVIPLQPGQTWVEIVPSQIPVVVH